MHISKQLVDEWQICRHCLPRPVCSNTNGIYDTCWILVTHEIHLNLALWKLCLQDICEQPMPILAEHARYWSGPWSWAYRIMGNCRVFRCISEAFTRQCGITSCSGDLLFTYASKITALTAWLIFSQWYTLFLQYVRKLEIKVHI